MSQYTINIGALPNDGTGAPLRTAFNETNQNFNQIFAAGPVLSNVQIANNSILTTNTNGNLVLVPNGTGVVQANASIVPNMANIRNLGSTTQSWSSIYSQYINTTNVTLTGLLAGPQTTKASTDTGTPGQICWDADYIYVCTATNTWKRSQLTGGY
jgi:hypothetical protein